MDGRFIISTGRSGSTLLSRALAQNSRLLVLSEFFSSLDNGTRFGADAIDGAELLDILSADDDVSALIAARGRASAEAIHEGMRNDRTATGRAPSLVRACLPALTDDPDGLFAEIAAEVGRWPRRSRSDQYRALFDWLCARLGKHAWVERSGFGIRLFPEIRRAFPDARFLHLHRDGMEAALSMYHHPWFRVGVYLDAFPPERGEVDGAIAGEDGDFVSALLKSPPPIGLYGRHWSNMLARAFADFVRLDANQYAELTFENLTTSPRDVLQQVADFLELPADPGWIERGAALVKGDVPRRAPGLGADERQELEAACRPGQILLGREDPSRLDEALARLREGFLRAKRDRSQPSATSAAR
jgi:putative sulfotransferase